MSSTAPSSSSSNFQLIVKALSDYAEQTGIDLTKNSFADELQNCDSADTIFQLLQDRAIKFKTYREEHRKLIKCLNPVVQFLHAFSGTLGEALVLAPFPPAKAIFVGVDVLLTAACGVSTSYDTLVRLFERVGDFLKRLHIYTEIPFTPALTDIIVRIMVEVLSVLALATKEVKRGRFKKFVKKLFGESKTEAVLQRLSQLTDEECHMTAALTLREVHDLGDNMKVVMNAGTVSTNEIQPEINGINKIKREQLQKDVRSWLSPPDPSKNHNIARTDHHDGTAAWFTQGRIFEEWKATGSLLWIRGKPGSGKSILCSTIIEAAKAISDAGLALVAYYYFDFRESAKQDIRGLLTSILEQLSSKSDRCCDILSELYSKHDAGSQQPGIRALKQCLIDMLGLPETPMTYIIVDALDECPDTSGVVPPREWALKVVQGLVDLHLPNLRLCFTSRPEADIVAAIEPLASHVVSLHDERGQKEDIRDYVKSVVYSDRKMRRWRVEDKELVIDVLVRKADGMFRWVACQLEMLRHCFPASLRDALHELPETLDTTYERILLEIKPRNREYTHRLLQCLTVAVRPLRVEELAEVLAIRFEAGKLPGYHSGWCLEDAQDAVLSACSSLISIVNIDGLPVVQFSHFSVKEFLTSDRLANAGEHLSRYHILPQPAHTILAQACLSALLRLDDHIDKNGMKKFPLSIYAAQHWVDHGRFEGVSSSIQGLMGLLFDPDKPHFATWAWIYNVDQPWDWVKQMSSERPTQPEAAALYYAVICGFRRLVEHLIVIRPRDINAEGGTHATPLHAALAKGDFDIALLLLERGADVNALDYRAKSPLHKASESGRRDIVEFLLGPHADARIQNGNDEMPMDAALRNGGLEVAQVSRRYGVAMDSCDSKGWTPLISASRCGHLDIVRLLLQKGAAVDLPHREGWTPLKCASRYGHLDIVRLLLQNGAAVDSRNNEGWTPLKVASRYGHLDIVRLLLQNRAAVDTPDNDGNTPVIEASASDHLDIVRLLLQNGAAVDSRNEGRTPLEVASHYGHLDIVRLLLQNGAAVDQPHNTGLAPLHFASQNGHLDLVRELLDHGAAVDLNTPGRETALHLASAAGSLNVARLLIERGADPNSRKNDGSTPCHTASSNGHLDIVHLLLERGTDVESRNGKHRTPLAVASENGILDVSYFLIERGADVNSGDDEGRTSLHLASESGHLNNVRLLLDHGANVNAQCMNTRTPLHLSSANGHVKVAELLVESGADVDKRNKSQETPLSEASSNGQLEIACLLLTRGSNLDSKDNKGCTPLHVAAQNGHLDIVKFLVESSADVNTRNDNEETPLDLAYRNGKRDVVIFLAEVMGVGGVDSWAGMGLTTLDVASQDTDSDVVESSPNCGDNTNFLDYKMGSLHTASRQGNVRTVRSLLGRGADVNERDASNRTPLDWASSEGRLEVAKSLIEHSGDVNSRDIAGWTPLHTASRYGNLNVARLLLDQGANVDAQQENLWTPLHLASVNGHLEIVKLLLERGANIHVRNDEGLTASRLASRSGEREIVRLLSEYGVN